MWVSSVFVFFIIYAFLGWVWESAYCTFREKKWANRGFLFGPVCPIYGFGVCGIIVGWKAVLAAGLTPSWWQIYIFCACASALLEYFTHWFLEKLFHARWWDYSDMPLNLNGRICLPATLFFGLGALLVVYVLFEPTMLVIQGANPYVMEALSLVLMALLACDTAITVSALTRFLQLASAVNNSINGNMDQLVASAVKTGETIWAEMLAKRNAAEAALVDAKDAAGARIFDARDTSTQMLERLRSLVSSSYMSASFKATIARVKDFKLPKELLQFRGLTSDETDIKD